MKYLKLFEAFESEILSNTLKFLSESGRRRLLYEIEWLSKQLDMPQSKFNDNFLFYLPFEEALELNVNITDEPCDVVSADARDSWQVKYSVFGNDGIVGETCQNGRIKRKWGRSTRMVTCPICGGTGIKAKTDLDVKWIKYWFDSKGNFVTLSAVDGMIRKNSLSAGEKIVDPVTQKVYQKKYSLENVSAFSRMNSGDKAYIKATYGASWTLGTIIKEEGNFFWIQNVHSGGEPSITPGSVWRKYGRYSWLIYNGRSAYYSNGFILEEIDKELDKGPDPYDWNGKLTTKLTCNKHDTLKDDLRTASFAIVVDVHGLKGLGSSKEFLKKSDIIQNRKKEKEGAVALMSDEEIKNTNIKRYMEDLASRIRIDENLKNIKKGALKIVGSNYAGYAILENSMSNLNYFVDYIYNILKGNNVEHNCELVNELVKTEIEDSSRDNRLLATRLNNLKILLEASEEEVDKLILSILRNFEVYLQIIWKHLNDRKIETLNDIIVVRRKLESIRNAFTERIIGNLRLVLRTFLSYATTTRNDSWIIDRMKDYNLDTIREAESEMPEFLTLVEGLL